MVDYTYADFENAGVAVLDETNCFVVSGESKYNTLQDLIDDAKKNPGKVKFATEVGAFTHLQSLAFQQATDTKLNIVDVGGAAQKTAALLGGQIM